jgi:adenosylhomocysteine nucleosidase
VSGPAEKRSLAERYQADVVDMESAAVAAVAREHGIEFTAIKAISDELKFEMPPFAEFVDSDGKFETMRFAAYIAMRPKWWSNIRQLQSNSKLASVNLSHAVHHLMMERSTTPQEVNIPLV